MEPQALFEILNRLRALPREAATVEFKSNLEDPAEIGQYLSALANAAALSGDDRAWLVWGVDNASHEVKGTVFDPFTNKAEGNHPLIIWLQQMTVPRADFTFHECPHPDGKVILLEIHPARTAPIAFRNIRYIRIDSHKTRLSDHPDKEARLWAKLGQKDDWSGEIVPDATLDDLEPEALAEARRRFTEYLIKGELDQDRHPRISKEDAARLRKFHLVEGRYPNIYVSAGIAATTGGQAQHIRKRGFDNQYCRNLLEELIRVHGPIGPDVIIELFMDKLPDSLDEQQKRAKIRNLTYELAHRTKVIENVSGARGSAARWSIRTEPN